MKQISPEIFFFSAQYPKNLVKVAAVTHLRLNLLRDTKTALLITALKDKTTTLVHPVNSANGQLPQMDTH